MLSVLGALFRVRDWRLSGFALMPKGNGLIVHAAGRRLDLLRGDASRIAKGHKVDWWIDRADVGTRFCFENAKAKRGLRGYLR